MEYRLGYESVCITFGFPDKHYHCMLLTCSIQRGLLAYATQKTPCTSEKGDQDYAVRAN
jgi:hypothetical protein